MTDSPITVLCVAATGQSGSTILTRLLGEVPGIVAAGEVGRVWDKGLVEDITCSCGRHFSACEFWTEVGERAFGGWHNVDGAALGRLRDSLSLKHLPLQHPFALPLLQWPNLWGRYRNRLERYMDHLQPVYEAIHRISGADVIVDSMKIPAHVYMMGLQMRSLDVRVAHHVRDSRGYAYSQIKFVERQGDPDRGAYRVRRPPWKSALKWDWVNRSFDHLAARGVPTTRVRYEDLVRDPAPQLRRVATMLGRSLSDDDLGFLHEGEAELGAGHIASGSRGRLRSGRIALREDLEWVSSLPPKDRRTVTTLTRPLLGAYGYRIGGPLHAAT
jgi:Sulfotransferase family